MRGIRLVFLMAAALILLAGCGAASQAGGAAGPSLAATALPAASATAAPTTGAAATTEVATATSPAEPTAASGVTVEATGTTGLAATTEPVAANQPAPATEPATGASSATEAPAATPNSSAEATAVAAQTAAAETIVLTLQPDSEAGYRVREQLAGVSLPNDAVGRTNAVTGTISIQTDGTVLADQSRFVVDLSTLRSDSGMRDNYIRRNTLQTDTYRNAVFVPTSVVGLLSPLPTSGDVNFKMTGDLTVRDVTKPVTWDVQAQVAGNELTGTATTSFKFGEFGMTPPTTMRVLSIEDNIVLEIKFRMTASS